MWIDLSPFKHKNFRNLFLGQLISSFGTQMTAVIIPFQVFQLTQSTFMTGLVSAIEFVFLMSSSLMGGVFADRYDRRKILLFCESALILAPLLLALNAWGNHPKLWVIFIIAGITSFLSGLHRPALEALTQTVVPPEDLPKISSIMPMRTILTMILSPMIGGLLLAFIGPAFTYAVDSLSFAISLLFLLQINSNLFSTTVNQEIGLKRSGILNEIKEGFVFIHQRKDILGSYVTDFAAMVFCNPIALYPALALALGRPESVGILYAAPAVGALFIGILSRWTLHVSRYGIMIIFGASMWSFSMLLIGFSSTFEQIVICLFCAGFFDMVSGIFRMSLWNETIPTEIRGRIAGFEMLGYSSGPLLGNALIGFAADLVGIKFALTIGGFISLGLIISFNLFRRELFLFQKVAKT